MSLLFTGGGSTRVDCGTGTALDNPTSFSVLAWIYGTATTQGRIIQKGSAPNNYLFQFDASARLSIQLGRGTGGVICDASSALTNFSAWATNTWTCVCGSADTSTTANNKLYMGNLSAALTEPSSYATQTAGSGGAGISQAGQTFFIGNLSAANRGFPGRIAIVQFWHNRVLTHAEFQALQWHPHVISGTNLFMPLGLAGTGTQPDWSGFLNNGTVTGATAEVGVPILPLYGGRG